MCWRVLYNEIMDLIAVIFFGFGLTALIYVLIQLLGRISKHLRIIRLQLEIQNPLFTSEELLELDKNIEYWREKMWKYKDDGSEKNKEIGNITFKLFWAHADRLNHYRVMIVEARKTGDPTKIYDKYEKWLDKNEKEIEKMEKKAIGLNWRIKGDLEKRSLDFEFLGKWDIDEN